MCAFPPILPVKVGLRRLSSAARLLLGCELGFNVAFYMLVPFVAGEMHGRGFSAAAIGVIVGTRALAQQGLFPLGGWAADRIGARAAIVGGCFLRALGFGLFAVSRSLAALALAALLSGAAAALFTPAMKAWLAADARHARREAFALAAMASQIGSLAGPLVGALLYRVGFPALVAVAGAVLLIFGMVCLAHLPEGARGDGTSGAREGGLREVVGNRRFLAFAWAMAGYAVLFSQLYLVLPLAFGEATGRHGGAAWLFAITALLVLLLQTRIAAASARRWSRFEATGRGMAVMGLGFVPCALVAAAGGGYGPHVLALAVVTGTAVLAVGMMMAHPFAMDLVSVLARERALGLHYGIYYGAGGLAATAGSAVAGIAYDATRGSAAAGLLWGALAVVGLACGFAIRRLGRRDAEGGPS